MARWRAVPTAVWTAAGALAFLAAGGVAVVLGAGLHVWSGPLTPAAPPAVSAAHPGRSGVVTVSPPAPAAPAARSTGPAPSAVGPLPFVPFGTASGRSSAPSTAGQAVARTLSGPVAPSFNGRALGLLRDQPRRLLLGLRDLRTTSTADKLLMSPTRFARTSGTGNGHAAHRNARHDARTQERHRHHHKHHGRGRRAAGHGDSRHGHVRPSGD